jgi:hypothetical protein
VTHESSVVDAPLERTKDRAASEPTGG